MRPRKVRCIETGEEFNSLSDAATAYGCTRVMIQSNCAGRRESAKGCHWEYVDNKAPTRRANPPTSHDTEYITFKDVDPDALKELVVAIVECAITDWKDATRILRNHPDSPGAIRYKLDSERFFLSDHFVTLTGVDGKLLLRRLRKEYTDGLV